MKYLSLFSGIGGLELGIQQAYEKNIKCSYFSKKSQQKKRKERGQWTVDKRKIQLCDRNRSAPLCVGYSETDKYAIQIYERHFKHKNYGDITKIIASKIPDHGLLIGGFPCQSFSVAGKRGGFKDTRGTLFFDIARILKVKKPKNFLLENVKGLLNHDKGNTFATIISTLDELGYDCQWNVLNSKNFGVPQNRERVFIVGHIRETPRPKVFPIRENSTGFIKILNQARHSTNRLQSPSGIARTLRSQAGGKGAKTGLYAIKSGGGKNVPEVGEAKRIYGKEGIAPPVKPHHTLVQPVLTPDRAKKRQRGRRFKEDGDPSFTLTGHDIHGISNGMRIRRLTPTECERLQGFPDGWTEGISDTQRYKCLGNAVTVNVIAEIIKKWGI